MSRVSGGMVCLGLGWVALFMVARVDAAANGVRVEEAVYRVQSAGEGGGPVATSLRIAVTGEERVGGEAMVWWEMTVGLRGGGRYGVRMLSERAPMTSAGGVGRVARYLYRDAGERVLEYRDEVTGRALLPALDFEKSFLPVPSDGASRPGGFATAGTFLGHTIVRVVPFIGLERVAFENPKLLVLRSDLLMGPQVSPCHDVNPAKTGRDRFVDRPCTREEMRALIDTGVNYWGVQGRQDAWLMEEPVFFRDAPGHPDRFYRSNYDPGRMFIDEPSIRFGWDEGVPGHDLMEPEQYANALRVRVADHYRSQYLKVPIGGDEGNLNLFYSNFRSWDTHYFSAWQTLAAGAPALVFEGRYREEGYGWHPGIHFGREGLDGLTFEDQLHCMNAFMRGAARAFDGDWGTSVYPEGDPALFERAFLTSHDMGARYLWFWVHPLEDGGGVGYETLLRLGRAVLAHRRASPRGDLRTAIRAAKVGIVLPRGYIYAPGTILGFEADQVSPGGATYGDISSAALWEGILCSQRGIAFDFLNDEPMVRGLGYERLVFVGEDASLRAEPPWTDVRAARGLTLTLEELTEPAIAAAQNVDAEFHIPRARDIVIDGELGDWKNASWIDLSGKAHGDLVEIEATVANDDAARRLKEQGRNYLGFTWAQLDTELQRTYGLEDYYILGEAVEDAAKPGIRVEKAGVVVTSVEPGSALDKGGIRPGDIITQIGPKTIKYEFQIQEALTWYTNQNALAFKLTRSGQERLGQRDNLSGDVAMAADDRFLYVAARVRDDVHAQPFWGWEFWRGDCVQIGLATTRSASLGGYGENDHEIGLALKDGRAVAWRYHGRQGQPREVVTSVDIAIARDEGRTLYEAAVPLAELAPLAPDLWPKIGFNVVVNDNDGEDPGQRKGRLELREGTMTRTKAPGHFAVAEFEPSGREEKVSAALFWRRRATPEGGIFRLRLAARSPATASTRVLAVLQSLDSPQTGPVTARLAVPLSSEPREWSLVAHTDSPPGRYALNVWVEGADGETCATERLPVYVYPGGPPPSYNNAKNERNRG